MKRQQHFLEALLKELKQTKHWPKYKQLADIMTAKLTTDLSKDQLLGLATIYRDFPLDNIKKGRPEVEDYLSEGVAYLVLAPGEPSTTIKELFRPLPDPSVAGLPVLILTSAAFEMEAKRVAHLLKTRGFGTIRIKIDSQESTETKSTLVLSSSDGKGAKVLRNLFPEIVLTKKQEKGRPGATLTIRSAVYVGDDTLLVDSD